MMQRPQSDATTLHQDAKTTGHGFRPAAQQDDGCGRAQGSATVSAHGSPRSRRPRGWTKRAMNLGVFPSGGCHVSPFRCSRDPHPRVFVNGTANSGNRTRRGLPGRVGRGSGDAATASLLAPAPATKTMTHRSELAAGTACHPRRSLHRPRVVEASAHRLTIAGAPRSLSPCSTSAVRRKADVSRFEFTHSFCAAGSDRGFENSAVIGFSFSSARPSTPPLF